MIKSYSYESINKLNTIFNKKKININNNHTKTTFIDIQIIQRGGFGMVFKVKNIKDSKEYALKIVPFYINKKNPQSIINCKISNKLKEVRYLEDLQHPNIINYRFAWIETGNILKDIIFKSTNAIDFYSKKELSNNYSLLSYSTNGNDDFDIDANLLLNINIQMELMNMSLKEYFKIMTKETREIKFIIINILQGVSYLHSKNIIHCDLKPQNILLNIKNGIITNVKIADFGLVMERENTISNSYLGTPCYTPPEAYQGIITEKYDIYSLGIIIFELCNNYQTCMEKMEKINSLKNKDIYNDLFIKQMLHNNFNRRPNINKVITYYENINNFSIYIKKYLL